VPQAVKYLCLAYYDVRAFEALPQAELDAIVGKCPAHDRSLRESGQLVVQSSLGAPGDGVAIRPRNGKPVVTDGPFIETKEQVGGFFIIEARDLNEAIRVASKHPAANLGERVGWGIEVRPIEGYEAA
jgi:hypothetical protein